MRAIAVLAVLAGGCTGTLIAANPDGGPAASDGGGDGGGPVDLAPAQPAIRLAGRFDHGDPAGPRFAWPGSTINLRFTGTQLTLKLRDESVPGAANTYTVVIDNAAPKQITCDTLNDLYPLASGLAPGAHEVTIVRNTEAFVGVAQLLGFDYGPGGALLPPPSRDRRIELIGDSITCGYGDEGANMNCGFTPATEDEELAYGAIAARALAADQTAIAWSGKGVYRNGDGSLTETMPILWQRTLPSDTASVWNFSDRPAAAVIIDLGTNDFAKGTPDEKGFTDAYHALVAQVRGRYPQAHVFCALGPMLSDGYPPGAAALTTARKYINTVVSELNAGGDARVHFIEFPVQDAANGYGCDWHPSLKTHQLMGAQLASAVAAALGW